MDITRELLFNNGFESSGDHWEDGNFCSSIFRKDVPHKDKTICSGNYHLTMWNESNTPYRSWSIQVDNEIYTSCGGIDLQTVEHFNTFMDLLDLDFKL